MTIQLNLERVKGSSVSGLDARLQVMEDEARILRVMNVYCHAIDYGPPELWAQCFTEDGVYQGHVPGRSRRIAGRAALTAYAAAHSIPPAKYPKHMLWAPVIDIQGDGATATGMFAVINDSPNGPFIEVYGRYEDELVRLGDGSWRFKSRTSHVEATAASFVPTPVEESQ